MKKNLQNKKMKYTQGSLLLELLIAFAIISVAMTVVVDAFVTSQRSQVSLSQQTDLVRAVNMLLEDMSREARVSGSFSCNATTPSPCVSGTEFFMTHIEGLNGQGAGENVSYVLNGSSIQKGGILITPPSINVTSFNVEILGTSPRSDQVRALITLTANDTNNAGVVITIQTSFTERVY
jgi:type II secretory pathway pseudopilin PulG